VDDGIREKTFDGLVGEVTALGRRDAGELEVVDSGGGDVAYGRYPQKPERLFDALGLRVQDPRFELDPHLDPDRSRSRAPDLPAPLYRTKEITVALASASPAPAGELESAAGKLGFAKAYIGGLFPPAGSEGGPAVMEEFICSVEFLRGPSDVLARVSSEAGGIREYRGGTAGTVIDQVINDLQEEFESAPVA